MTATERVPHGDKDAVHSMDDPAIYGNIVYQMSFKAAIEAGIICDYQILTTAVSSSEVKQLWEDNRFVRPAEVALDDLTAHSLAAQIAIKQVMDTKGVKKIISFHKSRDAAQAFRDQSEQILQLYPENQDVKAFYISGEHKTSQRNETIREFVSSKRGLITNARCMTEGVDIPSVDFVVFTNPKHSVVDVVQATGRALRTSCETGKTHGTIVIPIIVPDGMSLEEFQDQTEFKTVISIIRALASNDERIVESVKLQLSDGKYGGGLTIEVVGESVAENISMTAFLESVYTRTWDRLKSIA